jgi:hypothetical protein
VDVALLHQLVGAGNQLQSVYVAEVVRHSRSEHPSRTSCVYRPVLDVLGVRPHQVAERPFVGDLDLAVDGAHLVDGLDLGAESAVHAEHLS